MTDPNSYIVPARVNIRLVPVGISLSTFEKYTKLLKEIFEIRLLDVTPDRGTFNPQGFPYGRILFNYTTCRCDPDSLFLYDLEPFRKVFILVGVTDENFIKDQVLEDSLKQLKEQNPDVITHNLVVFGDEAKEDEQLNNLENVFFQKFRSLETIMCDISSNFLQSLSNYAASYKHVTLRSPGSIASGNITRITSSAVVTSIIEKQKKRFSVSFDQGFDRKLRVKARQQKLLGNLYLLSGRLNDSLKEFCESIYGLKSCNDYLWLGSALEGMGVCCLLLSMIGSSFTLPNHVLSILNTITKDSLLLNLVSSPSASPRSSLQSMTNVNANITTNTANSNKEFGQERILELLTSVHDKVISYYKLSIPSADDYVPQIVYCETILRYTKLCTMVHLNGKMDKNTFPFLVNGKKSPIEKFNPIVSESLDSISTFDRLSIVANLQELSDVEFEKLTLVQKCLIYSSLVSIYGDLQYHRKKAFYLKLLLKTIHPSLGKLDVPVDSLSQYRELFEYLLTVYNIEQSSTWLLLQKNILLVILSFSTKLDDHQLLSRVSYLLLNRFHEALSPKEQEHILKTHLSNISEDQEFFNDHLLQNLGYPDNGNNYKKISSSKDKTLVIQGESFVYNPYLKEKANSPQKFSIMKDEISQISLTLYNPYAFELDVANIELTTVTQEVKLKILKVDFLKNEENSHFTAITLKPKTSLNVLVIFIPLDIGTLEIDGFQANVCSCKQTKFKVVQATGNHAVANTTKSLIFDVMHPQPVLSLTYVSLYNSALMLLEGEETQFEVNLKNYSSIPIGYLQYVITDSTYEPLLQILSNRKLPVNEIYEIEYHLFDKKALRILNEEVLGEIESNKSVRLQVGMVAKRGMKSTNINLQYCHKKGANMLRNLDIPINVTVFPSIELDAYDFYPLLGSSQSGLLNEQTGYLSKFLSEVVSEGGKISDYCVLSLDLRNSWNEPLKVEFSFVTDVNGSFSIKEIIPSFKTRKLLLPLKRFKLSAEKLSEPIPSFREKQFIVDKISPEERKNMLQLFWYRHNLLQMIQGRWKNEPETRIGSVDTRGLRLSTKMVNTLSVGEVDIDLSLFQESKEIEGDIVRTVNVHECYNVVVNIHNNSLSALKGILRHVPYCMQTKKPIDQKVLFNGTLQYAINDPIPSGESRSFTMGAIFVEKGFYEWGVILDNDDNQYLETEPLKVIAR
ncbi:BA75_05138T0 [Komagataella pastoris]|uniref:BA75_05138T0 n=1 Tax=Komagataella pastoris TaxID=4922 RepID=A0A1B2JIE4_PICPA|nr:BA75_05138T0 [Komagataella pastoris]